MMTLWTVRALVVAAWLGLLCAAAQGPNGGTLIERKVSTVSSPRFGYFAKYVDCGGILVRGAPEVSDGNLRFACGEIDEMMAAMPHVRANMSAAGVELQVAPDGQSVNILPGHENDPPRPYLDRVRYRELYVACTESRLIAAQKPGDTSVDGCAYGFASAVFEAGLGNGGRLLVEERMRAAVKRGLWKGTWASHSYVNFFSELSLYYFGRHGHNSPGLDVEASRDGLRKYDPESAALLDKIYGGHAEPPVLKIMTARPVSSVQSTSMRAMMIEMVIANDTARALRVTRIVHDGSARTTAPGNIELVSEIMPYDRRIFAAGDADVFVVDDGAGKEVGRWQPAGALSFIGLTQ